MLYYLIAKNTSKSSIQNMKKILNYENRFQSNVLLKNELFQA